MCGCPAPPETSALLAPPLPRAGQSPSRRLPRSPRVRSPARADVFRRKTVRLEGNESGPAPTRSRHLMTRESEELEAESIAGRIVDFLRGVSPFDHLSTEALTSLARSAGLSYHEDGEELFEAGQAPLD